MIQAKPTAICVSTALVLLFLTAASGQGVDSRWSIPDVTDEQWRQLSARSGFESDDPIVLSVLSRLPNISRSNWLRYAQSTEETALSQVVLSPATYAGQVFPWRGWVKQVHQIDLSTEVSAQVHFDTYFLVELVSSSDEKVLVASRRVPQSWMGAEALNERASGFGYFMLAGRKAGDAFPVLAAADVSWHPEPGKSLIPLTPGRSLLARLGLDLAELDKIENDTLQAVRPEEQEVFFSILKATGQLDRVEASPKPRQSWDLVDIVRGPESFVGDLFQLQGSVRRITPVKVTSAQQQSLSGLQEYYQLDVFVRLGNRRLRFVDQQGNEVSTQGRFGVTVILAELPAELTDAGVENPIIEVPGFFFKQWRHRTTATKQVSPRILRPNPVFIGIPGHLKVHEAPSTGSFGLIMGVFLGGCALLIGALVWVTRGRGRIRREGFAESVSKRPDFEGIKDQVAQPNARSERV